MNTIFAIRMQGFPIASLLRSGAKSAQEPFAVTQNKRVYAVNALAAEQGLREGMTVREAKKLVPQSNALIEWRDELFLDDAQRWLDVACELANALESPRLDLAYIDLTTLPDPIDLALKTADRLRRLDLGRPEIALAPSKWIAEIALQPFEPDLPAERWMVDSPADLLNPMKIERLTPIAPEHAERLRFLGYRTIGAVAGLSLRALQSQFGDDALTIQLAASGALADRVEPNYPAHHASARLHIPDGLTDWAQTLSAYERLATRLIGSLKRLDAWSRTLELRVVTESGLERTVSRTFAKPLSTQRDLVRAIAIVTPKLTEPIVELRVRLPELEKVVRAQRKLDGARELNERKLSADNALRSIRQVYGDQAIALASETPVERRKRALREWSDATGWR